MSTLPVNSAAPMSSTTVTLWPDGSTLTSSALTSIAMSEIMQQLTAQMEGINPITQASAYEKVRLDWQTQGQPAYAITEDIAFLQCFEEDDQYNRIRDVQISTASNSTITLTTTYQRVWRIKWTFYGPNSFDRARLIRTALFADVFHDALGQSDLYLVTDIAAPTRMPELINEQWWERSDFSIQLNEGVAETLTAPSMASVEFLLSSLSTQNQAGFGAVPFGSGQFGQTAILAQTSSTTTVQE